jgi:hypothetical protein
MEGAGSNRDQNAQSTGVTDASGEGRVTWEAGVERTIGPLRPIVANHVSVVAWSVGSGGGGGRRASALNLLRTAFFDIHRHDGKCRLEASQVGGEGERRTRGMERRESKLGRFAVRFYRHIGRARGIGLETEQEN